LIALLGKNTILFGVVFGFVGTLLMAFTSNIILIYIFGIIRGIGSAFFSMVPMTMIVNQWFQKRKGLAIGLASGTSGVFGALAAPVLAAIIEASGWRFAFIVKGVFSVILALPALLIPYAFNPKDEDLLPYGFEKEAIDSKPIRQTEPENLSAARISFIALMTLALLNTMVVFVNQHLPGYGESVGLNSETASFMLSAVMIGNLTGKFSFGAISDKIGTVKTALGMISISTLSILILIFLQQPFTLVLGSFLYGAIFSVGGVALPLFSTEFFGPVTGVKVYSQVNFIASVGGAVSVSLVGFIYDFTGSFIPAFVMALAFNLINVVAILLAQKQQTDYNHSY
jgi:Sugar phosphate permease